MGRNPFIRIVLLAARVSASTVHPEEFDMSVDLEPVELSDHDLPPLTVERMAEHHAAFMSNAANPVYRAAWSAVEPYDPSAQTDLYKDALLFAPHGDGLPAMPDAPGQPSLFLLAWCSIHFFKSPSMFDCSFSLRKRTT
jgi:hypothetical protein